ncbi:MAG TPA: hypothetical protein VFY40_04590 [Blastocatellia bacterium]|nr:hypothetical protein [Blastocatellia bacterium]
MFNNRGSALALVALAIFVSAPSAQGQVKARRDKAPEKTKKANQQAPQGEPKREIDASSPSSVTLVEPPRADYLSGEANVAVRGNQNPVIRLGLSPNGVTMIEFPAADRFFALHPGNSDLVTIDESPTKETDHFLIVRAGSGFASPANMANAGRAPVTSIITQMQSGLVVTFLFYPVRQLAEQAHRVVVTYDRDEVIAARRAAGLAVNLGGAGERETRTTSLRISPPQITTPAMDEVTPDLAPASRAPRRVGDMADIDTSAPPEKLDDKTKDPIRAASLALTEATRSPRSFRKWSNTIHGLSLSVSPVREVGKRSQLVVVAVRNTKKTEARIIPGQPEIYLETVDGKNRPLQIEVVKKLATETTATEGLIPAEAIHYYAVVYETPILGARQRLSVIVGQTIAADEPATARLTSSKR